MRLLYSVLLEKFSSIKITNLLEVLGKVIRADLEMTEEFDYISYFRPISKKINSRRPTA